MNKIVIAVTGASGAIYARQLLDKLLAIKDQWNELAVIMTANAKEVWKTELGNDRYEALSSFIFMTSSDFHAPFASGSGRFNTMIIIPCSMGTLGTDRHRYIQ